MATEVSFSGITTAELISLERKIYNDLLSGGTVMSYSIRDQQFTFNSLQECRSFLSFIQSEINKRQTGGGFSLARFSNL